MNLSVLYRGPLTSCNYGCNYCPFAKRTESAAQLERDRRGLERFVERIRQLNDDTPHRWQLMLTPWGEALVRAWYRHAVAQLTHLPQVDSVCVQTNLSTSPEWIDECRRDRLTLWATYHPTEADRNRFVDYVRRLRRQGVRLSVGMVGVTEFIDEIRRMRRLLPDDVYLWINAQQPRPRPYTIEETAFFASVDPLFSMTSRRLRSRGELCRAGETSFTVDGEGQMRRCHFVDEVIGRFDDETWESAIRARRCPQAYCDCYLGKSQLKADEYESAFGMRVFERIPSTVPAEAASSESAKFGRNASTAR